MNRKSCLNALTIDVEEYFQVSGFAKWIDPSDWGGYASRVVESTQCLLNLLSCYDVRATFFIVGWVAERHPNLIRQIADLGHEIGSHSYWHQLIYNQSPTEFSADVERSLEAISRAVPQVSIAGYRAPSFSMTKKTLWAQEILRTYHFTYDSSIFPFSGHDRYGMADASRFAYQLESGLWEFPMSTMRLARRNMPVAGGGYFRLYPLWLTRWAINQINREGRPAILYLHPWEVDPEQPRMRCASTMARFRHYIHIDKVKSRLESLLKSYHFAPMSQVFSEELSLQGTNEEFGHRKPTHRRAYENNNRNTGRAVLPATRSQHVMPKTVG
ncbi:MAG: XrtA system polysaccharide deacetylase [Chloroflexota bacterium]